MEWIPMGVPKDTGPMPPAHQRKVPKVSGRAMPSSAKHLGSRGTPCAYRAAALYASMPWGARPAPPPWIPKGELAGSSLRVRSQGNC